MALDHTSTRLPARITFTCERSELKALIRALVVGQDAPRLKKALDWFYGPGCVVLPDRGEGAEAKALDFGRMRSLRWLKSGCDFLKAATDRVLNLSNGRLQRRSLFMLLAMEIEAELAIHERTRFATAAKVRKSSEGKK